METTPDIVTYAPLIAASAIGLGIIVTMAILAGKIIFRLGGLFTEVSNLSKSVENLRTDMVAGFQQSRADTDQLRADMLAGHETLREEIRRGADRTQQMVLHHRHNDTDGSVTFIVTPGND